MIDPISANLFVPFDGDVERVRLERPPELRRRVVEVVVNRKLNLRSISRSKNSEENSTWWNLSETDVLVLSLALVSSQVEYMHNFVLWKNISFFIINIFVFSVAYNTVLTALYHHFVLLNVRDTACDCRDY